MEASHEERHEPGLPNLGQDIEIWVFTEEPFFTGMECSCRWTCEGEGIDWRAAARALPRRSVMRTTIVSDPPFREEFQRTCASARKRRVLGAELWFGCARTNLVGREAVADSPPP